MTSLPRFPLRNYICLKVWYRIVGCLGSHLKIIKEDIEENFYFDKGVLACSMSVRYSLICLVWRFQAYHNITKILLFFYHFLEKGGIFLSKVCIVPYAALTNRNLPMTII